MSKRAFFPKVTLSCAQCQKPFVRTVAEVKKHDKDGTGRLFCGQSCATTYTNTKAGKTGPFCNVCGAKMTKAHGKRQCSPECAEVAKGRWREIMAGQRLNLPDTKCEECGAPVAQRTRAQVRRFCSVECKDAAHSKLMTGDGNPGWRGGVAQARYQPEVLSAFNAIRPLIVSRDEGCCVVCRSQDGLSVHHIDMDTTNNEMANLVTLCRECHTTIHAAERSKPPSNPWPWLKTYAEKKSSMTSR